MSKSTQVDIDSMLMPEIFRKISSQVNLTRKRDLILKLKTSVHAPALLVMFLLIYDWSIEFRIPDGTPPGLKLNRVPPGTDHTVLRTQFAKLYNFIVGGNSGISQAKLEQLYIQILENLHHTEADFMLRIFNKAMFKDWGDDKKYNIPFKLVEEAYPEIIWFNRGNGKEPESFNPFGVSETLGEAV